MEIRNYESSDYSMLCKWWEHWGWSPLGEATLSKTGLIVTNQGIDVASCFIYKTDSCVCWIEHYLINKQASKHARRGAIEFLIDASVEKAKQMGFAVSMSSVNHKGLIEKLIQSGYSHGDSNMSNLVRGL